MHVEVRHEDLNPASLVVAVISAYLLALGFWAMSVSSEKSSLQRALPQQAGSRCCSATAGRPDTTRQRAESCCWPEISNHLNGPFMGLFRVRYSPQNLENVFEDKEVDEINHTVSSILCYLTLYYAILHHILFYTALYVIYTFIIGYDGA